MTYFSERFRLLWLNLLHTYQIETAYFANNWGNVLSTSIYTVSFLLFVHVLFTNVGEIAGYSRNEVLFLTFLGQLNYYILFTWSYDNMERLIDDVNLGNLDLVLIRPVPSLFYITFRQVSLVSLARDAVVPLLLVMSQIDWTTLQLSFARIAGGLLVMLAGQVAAHGVMFLLAVPVFWLGETRYLLQISYSFSGNVFPWESFDRQFRLLFGVFLPIFVSVSVVASVMLGYSPIWLTVLWTTSVAVLFLGIKQFVWRLALRAYTSASS